MAKGGEGLEKSDIPSVKLKNRGRGAKRGKSRNADLAEAFLYTDKDPLHMIAPSAARIAVAASGSAGAVFTFLTCIDTGVSFFAAAVLIIISCAVFGAAMSLSERLIIPALGVPYSAYAIAVFALRERFCSGLANTVNIYLVRIDVKYKEEPFFDTVNEQTAASDTAVFVYITAVFVALAFSYGIVYKSSLPAVLTVSAPLAELCLYFGLAPSYLAFFMLISSWFAVFAIDLSLSENGQAYKKAAAQCGLSAVIIALLCAVTAFLAMKVSGYKRPERLDEINKEVFDYFNGGGFSEDIAEIRITELIKRDSTVNHGKLGDNGNITFSNSTALRVTMPKTSDTVYLRGYVGSVYTGNSWQELPDSEVKRLEMINSGFRTSGLNSLLMGSYNLKFTNTSLTEYSFSVDNVGTSSKYLYMPYNLVPESVSRYRIEADSFRSSGEDKWFGKVYDPSSVYGYRGLLNTAWIIPSASLSLDQNDYREFVYDNYLDVPDGFSAAAYTVFDNRYRDFITAEASDTGKSTLTDAVVFGRKLYYIKSWLRDNCEYSLKAGKLPAGKDFADYFITETRKGSCTHFSTAAVLLCRYAGIPARYAEGYVIKPSDFDSAAAYGSVCTVNVTDARAHAWAEVYINGFGWYPIEFTSGYGNVITAVTTEPLREETTVVSETETETGTETQTETETSAPTETVITTTFVRDDREAQSAAQPGRAETDVSPAVTEVTGIGVPAGTAALTEEGTHAPSVGFSVFGKHDGEARDVVYDITGLVVAVLAVSLVIALTALRRAVIVKSCRRALGYDNEKAAKNIYRRFMRLVRVTGMKPPSDGVMYSEYIEQLESGRGCFSDGIAGTVVNTALKAEFGGGALTYDEVREMYAAVGTAVKKYESTLNAPKRFFSRFILGIA